MQQKQIQYSKGVFNLYLLEGALDPTGSQEGWE